MSIFYSRSYVKQLTQAANMRIGQANDAIDKATEAIAAAKKATAEANTIIKGDNGYIEELEAEIELLRKQKAGYLR